MKHLNQDQQGLTFISWLIVFAIGGFFILLTLKIVPIYLENQSVKGVIIALEENPKLKQERTTVANIKELIKRGFKVNSIYDFPKDAIKVKKEKNRVVVDITYAREEPIIANIAVKVSFSEKLDLEIPVY